MTDELDHTLSKLHADLRATAIALVANDVRASYEAIATVLSDALALDPEVKQWGEWQAVRTAHAAMWAAIRDSHHAGTDIEPDRAAEVCEVAAIACTLLTSRIAKFDRDRRDAKSIIDGGLTLPDEG